jgi:hypothetical protein
MTYVSANPRLRPDDPGAPRIRRDVATVLAVAAIGAGVASALGRGDLGVLGFALVVADLLTFRLVDGTVMSSWPAVSLPLAAVAGGPAMLATAGLACLVGLGRSERRRAVGESATRLASAVVAWAVYRGVVELWPGSPTGGMVTSLAAAACSALVAERAWSLVPRGRGGRKGLVESGALRAAFAIGASGVLMALAVVGAGGRSGMGLWGVALFAIPLLAARWAFGRLHAIRVAYDQTIEALSLVPEIGGWVRDGHALRVAQLTGDLGRRLGLPPDTLDDLSRAARLHALGLVTLDPGASSPRRSDVARATAEMLDGADGLARPAALVGALALPTGVEADAHDHLPAAVLRVARDFEEICAGDARRRRLALDSLASVQADLYDRRVLDALAGIVDADDRDRVALGA